MIFHHPNHTIIVVTDDQLMRTDLSTGESIDVVRSGAVARPEFSELHDAVRMAFDLGPKKCGKAWILADEVWSGRVSLDRSIVAAIDEIQLTQALALDAESESGINPFDSQLSHVLIEANEEEKTWWVTQAESAQLDAINASVPTWVGELAGVTAVSTTRELPGSDAAGINEFDSYQSFSRQWLANHLSDAVSIPVINEASETACRTNPWKAGAFWAVAVLFCCFGLGVYGQRQVTRVTEAANVGQQWGTQLRSVVESKEREIRDIKKRQQERYDSEHQRRLSWERSQSDRLAVRQRPMQLLRALAKTANPSHWIQGIDMSPEHVVLSGLALDSGAVTKLSQRLESELDAARWYVLPAKMQIKRVARLVEFELTIIPITRPGQHLAVNAMGGDDVR